MLDSVHMILLSFFTDMERTSNDFGLRAIAADYCEDAGLDDWAEYLRWTVKEKKRPFWSSLDRDWSWFLSEKEFLAADSYSEVNEDLFKHLVGSKRDMGDYQEYSTMYAADFNLLQARKKYAAAQYADKVERVQRLRSIGAISIRQAAEELGITFSYDVIKFPHG